MKYYGIFENGILTNASQLPIYTDNSETREISQEEFDLFMSKEKDKELKGQRKWEIQERLNQLSQDIVQAMAGAYFEDLEDRKAEFQTLHNELRVLEGKEPREYNTQNSLTNT